MEEIEIDSSSTEVNKITLTSLDGDDDRPHVEINIFDIPICALLDSGSHRTMFNSNIIEGWAM